MRSAGGERRVWSHWKNPSLAQIVAERPLGRKGQCLKPCFPGGSSRKGSQVGGWSQAEQRIRGKKYPGLKNPPEKSGEHLYFLCWGEALGF